MTDTLYFLFLDEIYSPNLNNFRKVSRKDIFSHKNHLHFGISGVVVAASHLYDIYSKGNRIKHKYFPDNKDQIFHYVDILHNRGDFQELKNDLDKQKSFRSTLQSFVQNSNFKYSCIFVDKHELIKKHGTFNNDGDVVNINKIGSNLFPKSPFIDYNLYLLCLRQLLAVFYEYINNRKHLARGVVVAEARGKREDTELRSAFHKIYRHGIFSIKPTEFRGKILDLFIVPKTQNYIGTQLSDLVLYPTYDGAVSGHGVRNDHIISFEKVLKRKLLGDVFVLP
ncbi:hypothetical protein KKG65_03480 [Patescibacteria group bacterium]|nr:hypothetical protein [Patescibacteria group bacterium]